MLRKRLNELKEFLKRGSIKVVKQHLFKSDDTLKCCTLEASVIKKEVDSH